MYRSVYSNSANGTYLLNFTAPSAGTYTLNVKLASGDMNTPDGLLGTYYNNRWLYGDYIFQRVDKNMSIDFNDGLVTTTAKDYVSVSWTGYIKPSYAETYTFSITSDV